MHFHDLPSVGDILRALVETDTRNPPGNECRLARVAIEILDGIDLKAQIVDLGANRANLLVKLDTTSPERPPIILNGHMDRV